MRRLITFTLAFLLGSGAGMALAQTGPAPSSISLAGEQRMLSQRIVKLYCQIGLNVMPSPAWSQLTLASTRFEDNLAALKPVVATSVEAARAHQLLAGEWLAMKRAAAAPVSREAAQALARQAQATLAVAELLTRVLEQESKSASSQLVNLAGRQRMLSQRIAATYLLLSWGVESAELKAALDASAREFSAGLATLRGRPDNSEQIRGELEEVAQQWEWLQASMAVEGAGAYRLIVAESADAILEGTERVTRLYEQASRR